MSGGPINVQVISSPGAKGAGVAVSRIVTAIQKADDAYRVRLSPTSGIPLSRKQRIRLLLGAIRRRVTRLLGSSSVHSVGRGLHPIEALVDPSSDLVLANWVGDDTCSIEEFGRLNVPLIVRNPDLWWINGTVHYPQANRWASLVDSMVFGLSSRSTRLRKKKAMSNVWCTVSPSEWMREQIAQSGVFPGARHFCVPNVLDTAFWGPMSTGEARERLALPSKGVAILSFAVGGRVADPRKGLKSVLGALKLVSERCKDREVWLVVAGRPPGRLSPLRWRLNSKVRYSGPLDEEGLKLLYCASDLVMVPSKVDNLPQVAIEAQSCGRAVIGFEGSGGLGEIVVNGETGLLVDPAGSEGLASAVIDLLNDPAKRDRFGSSARKRALELWSEHKVADQWIQLFSGALDTNQSLSPRDNR